MPPTVKILIVDDHPLIIEGYKSILNNLKDEYQLLIETTDNCTEAFLKVQKSKDSGNYDIVFLDISLPPSEEFGIYSGEDLGLEIKKISPESKVIVMTMHNENFRIYNIVKTLNPEAFLIKSDVSTDDLKKAFTEVLNDNYYYSKSVNDLLRKQVISDVKLDQLDRSILYHLSRGVRTKELSDHVPLSLAAIEKRKRYMKEALDAEKGGDLMLIEQAKKYGFL